MLIDDITQINEEQKISEQLPEPQSVAEHSPAQDSISRNLLCSVSSVFVEQREGTTFCMLLTFTAMSELGMSCRLPKSFFSAYFKFYIFKLVAL